MYFISYIMSTIIYIMLSKAYLFWLLLGKRPSRCGDAIVRSFVRRGSSNKRVSSRKAERAFTSGLLSNLARHRIGGSPRSTRRRSLQVSCGSRSSPRHGCTR
jgi:hypothetical protein